MSRNGLELSTAATSTTSQLEADAEAEVEAEFAEGEAANSSRSPSTSPTLPVILSDPKPSTTYFTTTTPNTHRASPKKRVLPNTTPTTESPLKLLTQSSAGPEGRRQFTAAPARTKRSATMPVATSTAQHVAEITRMAPPPASRPSLISNSTCSADPRSTLPPLDNCDSIFAIVSLPGGGGGSGGSGGRRPSDHTVVSNGVNSQASAKKAAHPLPLREHNNNNSKRSFPASSPPPPPPPPPPPLTPPSPPPVDWKSQLNYELTMYQKMLANQAHRSPMLQPAGRPLSLSSSNPSGGKNQPPSSQAPKSSGGGVPHQQSTLQSHLHHHNRQQTPNSKLISSAAVRQGQSQNHSHPPSTHLHQVQKQESRSSARKTPPSPVKSPVNSNGSTELTLDEDYPSCWTTPAKTPLTAAATPSRQLSPTGCGGPGDSKKKVVASLKTPTVNLRSSSGGGGGGGREGHSVSMAASPYEQLLYAMENDNGWAKEVAFGRRIGLYRFKGDIGNGNFSQVKVAIHSLTKGNFRFFC